VSEHIQRTGVWKPIWSSSRSRWLQACPRRYILQYVAGRGGRIALDRPKRWLWKQGRWAPPRELMSRAVRDTLRKWMFEAHARVLWTLPTARKALENEFSQALEVQNMEMMKLQRRLQSSKSIHRPLSESMKKEILKQGELVLRRAYNHPLLGELLKCGFHGEWQPLDPFTTTRTATGTAYLTPDIIIKGPQRWVLIRISTNAWKVEPDDVGVIESAGMLLWAINEPTLPVKTEEYEIARISHTEKGWRTWRIPAQQRILEDVRVLIKTDLNAARQLMIKAGPEIDIDVVPLSEKDWRCRTCGYRFNCPGGSDLQGAKIQQMASEKAMRSAIA